MALHFVNAGIDSIGIGQTQEMMKVIQNIVNIVKYHFNIELNENSIQFMIIKAFNFEQKCIFNQNILFYPFKSKTDMIT